MIAMKWLYHRRDPICRTEPLMLGRLFAETLEDFLLRRQGRLAARVRADAKRSRLKRRLLNFVDIASVEHMDALRDAVPGREDPRCAPLRKPHPPSPCCACATGASAATDQMNDLLERARSAAPPRFTRPGATRPMLAVISPTCVARVADSPERTRIRTHRGARSTSCAN